MKNILYIILGGVITFFIIEFIKKSKGVKPVADSKAKQDFQALLRTDEAEQLISSPEFRAVLLTSEFRVLMKGIADQYLSELTKVL